MVCQHRPWIDGSGHSTHSDVSVTSTQPLQKVLARPSGCLCKPVQVMQQRDISAVHSNVPQQSSTKRHSTVVLFGKTGIWH